MLWVKQIKIKRRIEAHSHAMHEFLVCRSGAIKVDINQHCKVLQEGSALFIPADLPHSIENIGNDDTKTHQPAAQVLLACVDPITLDMMRTPLNTSFIDMLKNGAEASHAANDVCDGLIQCVKDADLLSNKRSTFHRSLEENCFLKMLLIHAQRLSVASDNTHDDHDTISKVSQWLKEHYFEDIFLDDLSSRFSLSRSQLTRKFKQQYGYSLIEYVLQLRFDAAAKQLALSQKDITGVAMDAGFNNLSHFHRQFKRRYGMTPLTFRNMTRQAS